jgi:hypothetical protein
LARTIPGDLAARIDLALTNGLLPSALAAELVKGHGETASYQIWLGYAKGRQNALKTRAFPLEEDT